MKYTLLILCITLISISEVYAQKTISGKVFNQNDEPVAFANVIVYAYPDSAITKTGYSLEDGSFALELGSSGDYFLDISHVGMETYRSEVFQLLDQHNLSTIYIKPHANQIEEVVVKGVKNMFDISNEKTVFNIDKSINATGSNALELVGRAPGILVGLDNKIRMHGKSGTAIYVNGKRAHLTGAELASMLSSIQSEEIKAIEIITDPSAKYDAQGNAGVINIIMKKPEDHGWNANINANVIYGKNYRSQPSIGINFRNNLLNVYSSLGASFGKSLQQNFAERTLSGHHFNSEGDFTRTGVFLKPKLGVDFFPSPKTTIGLLYSFWNYPGELLLDSKESISTLPSNTLIGNLYSNNTISYKKWNHNLNVNYVWSPNPKSSLSINANYGQYNYTESTNQSNEYISLDPFEPTDSLTKYQTSSPSEIQIGTGSIDYSFPIFDGKIDLGLKSSSVKSTNQFDFFGYNSGAFRLDSTLSNSFFYDETIYAAYVSLSKPLSEKIKMDIGIRMEQSNTVSDLVALNSEFNKRVPDEYLDWFPNVAFSYNPSKNHAWRWSYNKRINRPNYRNLNPFELKLSELNYRKGNPFLTPEYAHSTSLNYTFKRTMKVGIRYSKTTDLITQIVDTTNLYATFDTWGNLASEQVFGLDVSRPFHPLKAWTAYLAVSSFHTIRDGDFGQGRNIELAKTSAIIKAQNSIKLPKQLGVQVSAFYYTPGLYEGAFEMDAFWRMDVGFSKRIFNGNGNLKLSFKDIFYTQKIAIHSNFGGQELSNTAVFESRNITFSASYKFGNSKVKKERKRKTGMEEVDKRAKASNL